jgi:hypothetical protein
MEVESSELLLPPLRFSHFEEALQKVKPSVSPADLERHLAFAREFGSTLRDLDPSELLENELQATSAPAAGKRLMLWAIPD